MFFNLNKHIVFPCQRLFASFYLMAQSIIICQCIIIYLTSSLSMVMIPRYFCYYKQHYNEHHEHDFASVSLEIIPMHRLAGSKHVTIVQVDEH